MDSGFLERGGITDSTISENKQVDRALQNQQYSNMIDEKVEQSKASDLREIECDAASNDGSLYLSRGSAHERRMMESTLDGPKVISKLNHPIYRICLTGGPCAGKTTALVSLAQVLSQLGFRVL